MLYTRNAKLFREYYKVEKAQNRDKDVDIDFIDLKHPDPKNFKKGFGSLIFGSGRDNVENFLRSTVLNVAADQQSVYEMIQNADDCDASFINISYNEKYLLCINNGKPFTDRNMAGLINVGDSDKTQEEIGTYGIGFKIVHRLLGDDDGADAIVKNFAGSLIFSWNKFIQFDRFLNKDEIKIGYDKEMDKENPWLIKLIYTCFPTHLNEQVRISDYQTKKMLFESSELDEFRTFLSESLSNLNISKDEFLKTGTMFFLKLADGKSKSVIEKNIEVLKSGIAYSFNFLQSLSKIYINGESILAQKVQTHTITYKKDSEIFNKINPRNKERPIEAKFGYKTSFKDRIPSEIPNFYTFFSMDDEKNNFGFILHCNAFDMHSDRRKLQPDSQSNPRLFAHLTPDILNFLNNQKGKKFRDKNLGKNIIPYNELYATFLLADVPKNKSQILEGLYLPIKQYLLENIPTLNQSYSNNSDNVKIKATHLPIQPYEFDCHEIEWFAWWKNDENKELINESKNPEKLGLKEWDIVDLIKYAIGKGKIEYIDSWVRTANDKYFSGQGKKDYTYLSLLQEVDKKIHESDFSFISQVKLFRFSDGNYYSFNEIESNSNLFLIYEKVWPIKKELRSLGFIVSDLNLSYKKEGTDTTVYSNLEKFIVPKIDEDILYKAISEKCKLNDLHPDHKLNLFFTLKDFSGVGSETLKDLELFKDAFGNIRPLRSLLKEGDTRLPNWLNNFKINQNEYSKKLDTYLIKETDIYQSIIYKNWDFIIGQKLNIVEFYTNVTYYYKLNPENQKLDKLCSIFTNDGFKKVEQVFFNTYLNGNYFFELQNVILKISDKAFPSKLIFDFLIDDNSPFKINRNDTFSSLVASDWTLSYSETSAVLSFAKNNNERLFSFVSIEKKENDFLLNKNNHSVFQYYSSQREINEILLDFPNFKLLPKIFNPNDFKDLGLLQDKELYLQIIKSLDFSENLLPVVRECDREVQFAYLEKIDVFLLKEGNVYDKNSFEHLCLKLAIDCYVDDFQTKFGHKILINEKLRLDDIAVKDNVNFESVTLSLASILPEYKGVSDIVTNVINQFTEFTKTELSEKVFLIKNKKKDEIYSELTEKYPVLLNIHQFSFLLFYSIYKNQNLFTTDCLSVISNEAIIEYLYKNNLPDASSFFNLGTKDKIYPSEFALEKEYLSDEIVNWLESNEKEDKLIFLSKLGVNTKNSTVCEIRSFFINKTEFDQNKIAKESCFADGLLLSNTIHFIVQKNCILENPEQFSVLKEIVRVHNSLPPLKLIDLNTDNFNREEIIQNRIESEFTSEEFKIYLFKGKMPRLVVIDGFDNHVFYKYNEGEYFVDGTNIYINEKSDHKKTLEKVVSDEDNDFKFEDLWKLYNTKEPSEKGPETIKDILPDASDDEITYISEIINISRDKDGEIDANSTAKIKTLMLIKGEYVNTLITDKGRYLEAGNDEILVRSAQKGLLYIDLFHWERLTEDKVKIAIYTNNQINIFNSQEDLFQFCKPQNTFGVLRMPNDYNLDDYNNLGFIKQKSKWHFVFIVNKDAKDAKIYKEFIDYSDPNLFDVDNF